jgi:parallel beta-helix repeat protein
MKKIILSLILIGLLSTTSTACVDVFDIDELDMDSSEKYYAIPMADIYVDDDAPPDGDGSYENPYQTIKTAIDNASSKDIIYVFNGSYYENILLNRSIILKGENKHTTTIFGTIEIIADQVTVSRFTVKNTVYLTYASEVAIYNNVITGFTGKYGIRIWQSPHAKIVENTITNIEGNDFLLAGIFSDVSKYGIIKGNTITNLSNYEKVFGMFVCGSSKKSSIMENTIKDLKECGDAWAIFCSASYSEIVENTIINIEGNGMTEAIVAAGDYVNILQNSITNIKSNQEAHGIHLYHSLNNTVVENIIKNISSRAGVYISLGDQHTIQKNIIIETKGSGIESFLSENLLIEENSIINVSKFGIRLEETEYSNITRNLIISNRNGILLYPSSLSGPLLLLIVFSSIKLWPKQQ